MDLDLRVNKKKPLKKWNFEVRVMFCDSKLSDIDRVVTTLTNYVYTWFKNDKSYIMINMSLYYDSVNVESEMKKVNEIQIFRYDSKGNLVSVEHYDNCKYKSRLIDYDYEDSSELQVTYVYTYEDVFVSDEK